MRLSRRFFLCLSIYPQRVGLARKPRVHEYILTAGVEDSGIASGVHSKAQAGSLQPISDRFLVAPTCLHHWSAYTYSMKLRISMPPTPKDMQIDMKNWSKMRVDTI